MFQFGGKHFIALQDQKLTASGTHVQKNIYRTEVAGNPNPSSSLYMLSPINQKLNPIIVMIDQLRRIAQTTVKYEYRTNERRGAGKITDDS